jgi:Fur family ferric uptake transcriptional regulator
MKSKDNLVCEAILLEHGYRLTPGRIALLMFLKSKKVPLTATDIQNQLSHMLDKVTLYRALEDFVSSKIIAKVNLNNQASYYEFIHHDHHHHHIICEKCGKIEDIENCNQVEVQKEVIRSSKYFTTITSHSLEFFGVCNKCL